jgi:hypothetical protein
MSSELNATEYYITQIGDNSFLKRGKLPIFGNKSDNQITVYDKITSRLK